MSDHFRCITCGWTEPVNKHIYPGWIKENGLRKLYKLVNKLHKKATRCKENLNAIFLEIVDKDE